MEARLVSDLPDGDGWQFEPKWDGFRCVAFRAGEQVELRAKSGKSLSRFFPEMLPVLTTLARERFVLDGELAIAIDGNLSFDALQARLHPAESRVRKLSVQTPAMLILFDCLAVDDGVLLGEPLTQRRTALEGLFHSSRHHSALRLTPYTRDAREARRWLSRAGGALDGIVAKLMTGVYEPGRRAMLKVKKMRTADCVVGGFRYEQNTDQVGSLLGLYNKEGKLDHVGFTSAIARSDRLKLTARLESMVSLPGFSGNAPGGPSRWSTDRTGDWKPLAPELVVEVRYDHVTGNRFRHGTKFLRWRPDKAPAQCTFEQMEQEARPSKLAEKIIKGEAY